MKSYNKYDIDKYQIDTIKSILFDNNKTWIKSYIIKHGIDKEKLYNILNGNFSHENYPEISYWKTHHFKLFIEFTISFSVAASKELVASSNIISWGSLYKALAIEILCF